MPNRLKLAIENEEHTRMRWIESSKKFSLLTWDKEADPEEKEAQRLREGHLYWKWKVASDYLTELRANLNQWSDEDE